MLDLAACDLLYENRQIIHFATTWQPSHLTVTVKGLFGYPRIPFQVQVLGSFWGRGGDETPPQKSSKTEEPRTAAIRSRKDTFNGKEAKWDWPCPRIPGTSVAWWSAEADLAACRWSRGAPGGSGRWGKETRQQAEQLELKLESRTPSPHGARLRPAGRCRWLWRGGSRKGEAGYCRFIQGRGKDKEKKDVWSVFPFLKGEKSAINHL